MSFGLVAILIGTLVGTYGNSMANLVVPAVMSDFGVRLSDAVWLVSLYTLNFSVFMPVCGYLGSILGYRKLYLVGMTAFTLACLGCGLAPSLPWLLVARTLQGIAYAPILPAVMVILARSFPPESRGRAMGYWALVNGAAHASGPLISGFLIGTLGWRSVFLFNVPLSLACVFMVWKLLPADIGRPAEKFDLPGAGLLSAGILSLLLALTTGSRLGWGSLLSLMFWVISFTSLVLLIRTEKRAAAPLVDLELFGRMGYTCAIGIISAESFALFGLLLALPILLVKQAGWTSQAAGLFILPLTLVMALTGPFAGRLADRRGFRLPGMLGMGLAACGGVVIAVSLLAFDSGQAWQILAFGLVMVGLGMGLAQSPVTAAVIHVVDEHQVGVATGIFHMSRFIAGSLGSTVFGLIIEMDRGGISAGFTHSMLALIAVVGLAFFVASGLPGKPAARMETYAG